MYKDIITLLGTIKQRLQLLLLFSAAFSTTAFAYDNAVFHPLGFTADNKVFAYEYYGGSSDEYGGPHATVVFVNLDSDHLIEPTPIETRYEYSGSADYDLQKAIYQSRAKAKPLFDRYALLPPGAILAARVYGQRNTGIGNMVVFSSPLISRDFEDPTTDLTIKVENIKMRSQQCGQALGYRLSSQSSGVSKILYEDKMLPNSRHCPIDYQLRYVLTSLDRKQVIVVIEVGFPHLEGPAFQYIVKPIALTEIQ